MLSPSPPLTPTEQPAETSEAGQKVDGIQPEPPSSPVGEVSHEPEKPVNHAAPAKEAVTESPPRKSKPFNLSKIQGPNLSESESDSEDVEPVKTISPVTTNGPIKENGELDSGTYVNGKMGTETPPPSVSSAATEFPSGMNVDDGESVKSSSMVNEMEGGGSKPDGSLNESKMDVDGKTCIGRINE